LLWNNDDKNTIKRRIEHEHTHILKVLEGCGKQKFAVWQTSCNCTAYSAIAVLIKKGQAFPRPPAEL
ncbi:MAG: hypothetical protein ACI4WV_07415, partial [Eubacteriales bacterium]